MATNGDPYVQNVQEWVNDTFRGCPGYTEIPENGKTGWTTIYALLHGLQITLGISATADNFGPGTVEKFNLYLQNNGPIMEQEELTEDVTRQRINGIIQGALLCKGYSIGATKPTGQFMNNTGNAIKRLRSDVGITSTTTEVTLNLMKALLSMDYFYSFDDTPRTNLIILMQRYLNANYEDYAGLNPCDGIYGRRTNKALIYAIQAEEKILKDVATGTCGTATTLCLPNIPYSGSYEKDGKVYGKKFNGRDEYLTGEIEKFKRLFNIALFLNGFGSGLFQGDLEFDAINEFQRTYGIPETQVVDITTWLSVLTTCGDPDRKAIACDTSKKITNENINVLKENGYKYIGRYLANVEGGTLDKETSLGELQLLFQNGIRVFPIQQRSGNYIEYFTLENAHEDAEIAYNRAKELHLQFGAIIYFSVDFDAVDTQITSTILPYFKELFETFMSLSGGMYRVGVYGPRNACTRICNAGYACSSFVSDMSNGFSGNLGFPIPDNWAFDQFKETEIEANGVKLPIDKDGFSGRYEGILYEYDIKDGENNINFSQNYILVNRGGNAIPVYEGKKHVNLPLAQSGPAQAVTGEIIGRIKPNDFYIYFGLSNTETDNIHLVLFNDGVEVRTGYIEGRQYFDKDVATSNEKQMPLYQEPYSCLRYLPEIDDYELILAGSKDLEITINKPVPYFDVNGNFIKMLNKGDKIVIAKHNYNNCGFSRPWCYRVSHVLTGGVTLLPWAGYVSTGLEYASSGSERAWY